MARVSLSPEQHRRLARLIAANGYMLTPGGRQTILDEAGLADFRTRLDFASDARSFAAQLVRVVQDHGTLAETGQPALVSLLRWLREEVSGQAEDTAFVDGLLAPYPTGEPRPDPASPASLPPSETVRALLTAAFSDGELTTFAFDHFRPVYDDFASGMARSAKVQRLVEHAELRGETARLLALVKKANSYQYGRLIGALPVEPRPRTTESPRDLDLGSSELPPDIGPIRKRWALLIGVNRYVDPSIPPLRFCVNDVKALEARLTELGYTVVALHDEAEGHLLPTRDNVEAALARLSQAVRPDDLLLVHFSGHGKLVGDRPVLLTQEVHQIMAARRALPVAEIEQALRESGARRRVLWLDACHSGVALGRDLVDPAFVEHVYEKAEGFALLAATSADAVALEWGEEQHGAFTYYLLEGLSGKADRSGKRFVSFRDLESHVLDALRTWSIKKGGLVQVPTARWEGRGDMVIADFREAAPPP